MKMDTGVSLSPPSKPRMYLDLDEGDLDVLEGLKIGTMVSLVVRGKVVGMSKRESQGLGEKKKTARGDIQLENFEVDLESKGDFEDLAEDD